MTCSWGASDVQNDVPIIGSAYWLSAYQLLTIDISFSEGNTCQILKISHSYTSNRHIDGL